MAHVPTGSGASYDSLFRSNRKDAWPTIAPRSVESGRDAGPHRTDPMVPMNTTSDFLLEDARAALRRRVSEEGRTELNRVFATWLGLEIETDAKFAPLVDEAAHREGAQQDFPTVAILGFGADAGILGSEQIEALKKGLWRQAGRGVVIDEWPAAFCSDAVGILGIALGTKVAADSGISDRVVKWFSKFLKNSYDEERTKDWQRCLFAAGDRQLGSLLNLRVPKSPAIADVRTALVAKRVIECGDDGPAGDDALGTLSLAMRGLPGELFYDRAALRLAAVEPVIFSAPPQTEDRTRHPRRGAVSSRIETCRYTVLLAASASAFLRTPRS